MRHCLKPFSGLLGYSTKITVCNTFAMFGVFLAFYSVCILHSECMNKCYLLGTMPQTERNKKEKKKKTNTNKKPQPFPTANIPKSPYATLFYFAQQEEAERTPGL